MAKQVVTNPVKRRGTYPDQKPIHPTDISRVQRDLVPGQEISIQTNGRSILFPVLKKISDYWTDCIGEIEIIYDDALEYVFIKNVSDCNLTIRFTIV